jgi:hypothetical protein
LSKNLPFLKYYDIPCCGEERCSVFGLGLTQKRLIQGKTGIGAEIAA